ncbi:MAG TPA: hypothetical protein VKY22_28970 [Bradyrhizobium sp.]|nr:hypothetical protein [Bradyrhizobium sp.]
MDVKRYAYIDALRGYAILLVMLFMRRNILLISHISSSPIRARAAFSSSSSPARSRSACHGLLATTAL